MNFLIAFLLLFLVKSSKAQAGKPPASGGVPTAPLVLPGVCHVLEEAGQSAAVMIQALNSAFARYGKVQAAPSGVEVYLDIPTVGEAFLDTEMIKFRYLITKNYKISFVYPMKAEIIPGALAQWANGPFAFERSGNDLVMKVPG